MQIFHISYFLNTFLKFLKYCFQVSIIVIQVQDYISTYQMTVFIEKLNLRYKFANYPPAIAV